MALTRKLLKGMGLTEEQVDTIIEAHTETVDGLKAERDRFKSDADKLPDIQKKLDDALKDGGDDYKSKYEAERDAFKQYKEAAAAKEKTAQWEKLYRARLDAANVDKARQDAILRVADREKYPVKDGKFEDEAAVDADIKSEWSAFISTTGKRTHEPDKPPANTGGAMTKEQIMAMTDRAAKRTAIAENIELFTGGNK